MITTKPCECGCGTPIAVHRHADGRLNKHYHPKEPRYFRAHHFQLPEKRAKCRAAKNGNLRRTDLAPTVHPTIRDIAWVAGFYEGEGSCGFESVNENSGGIRTSITQKTIEPLEWVRARFGGRITLHKSGYQWRSSGARGRGFLLTIFPLLSTRRKGQVGKAFRADVEHVSRGRQRDAMRLVDP